MEAQKPPVFWEQLAAFPSERVLRYKGAVCRNFGVTCTLHVVLSRFKHALTRAETKGFALKPLRQRRFCELLGKVGNVSCSRAS